MAACSTSGPMPSPGSSAIFAFAIESHLPQLVLSRNHSFQCSDALHAAHIVFPTKYAPRIYAPCIHAPCIHAPCRGGILPAPFHLTSFLYTWAGQVRPLHFACYVGTTPMR